MGLAASVGWGGSNASPCCCWASPCRPRPLDIAWRVTTQGWDVPFLFACTSGGVGWTGLG
eukprot:scaffold35638_cov34-Isochrysis_galbana.AAC.1